MGIVNGIANAMGIVVPMVVALMVDGNVSLNRLWFDSNLELCAYSSLIAYLTKFDFHLQQTFEGWRTVYLIAMAIYVFGALMWTFLGTADVQPWDTYWIKVENKDTRE